MQAPISATDQTHETCCCIVGAGPAGVMLSLLLARGVGINCAIADAVEAVNVLVEPLRAGRVQDAQLAEVQRRRDRLTRIVQRAQAGQQKQIIGALRSGRPFRLPPVLRLILRVPVLRNLPARVIGFGVRRARLERPEERRVVVNTA